MDQHGLQEDAADQTWMLMTDKENKLVKMT
jgi:hypothetical protein